MATTDIAQLQAEQQTDLGFQRLNHWQKALIRLRKDTLTMTAIVVFAIIAIASYSAPIFNNMRGVSSTEQNLQKTYASPDSENWLGTDSQGRDHLARLLEGGQVSLRIAFFAAILSLSIGVSFGMITGYYGGMLDDVMIWFITTLNSIPGLFLLLLVASLLEPAPWVFILILGLLGWTGTMRLVRGETLAVREREYVVAARALGASDMRIMSRHIFPNLISLVIISLALDIAALILAESALSFLGFGVPPSTPTWGNMLNEFSLYYRRAPHLIIFPGLLISITVLCMYIIGDGVRDALDPTTRN